MTRFCWSQLNSWLNSRLLPCLVLCLAAGLLPGQARAQVVVDGGTPRPAERALLTWFRAHIPARFQARERFVVTPLADDAMEAYLSREDTGGQSHADDGEIDGVFEDNPPRITLRLPAQNAPDMNTFAHEYGHYVWFRLLSLADRDRYTALYKRQKAAHRLVSRYAEMDVEEGFAEAFSCYVNAPAALRRLDRPSADFLRAWPQTP